MRIVPQVTYFHFHARPVHVANCDTDLGLGIFDLSWQLDGEAQGHRVQTTVTEQGEPCRVPPLIADFEQNLAQYVPAASLLDEGWSPQPLVQELTLNRDDQWVGGFNGFGRAARFKSFSLSHDFPACCGCLGPLQGCRMKRIVMSARYDGTTFPTLDVTTSDEQNCGGQWWLLPVPRKPSHMPFGAPHGRQPGSIAPDDDFGRAVSSDFADQCVRDHNDGDGKYHAEYDWWVDIRCDCRGSVQKPEWFWSFGEHLLNDTCKVVISMSFNYALEVRD